MFFSLWDFQSFHALWVYILYFIEHSYSICFNALFWKPQYLGLLEASSWLSFFLRFGHISLSRNFGLYYGYCECYLCKFWFLSCSSKEFWFLCFSEQLIGLDSKWKLSLAWGWQLLKSRFDSFGLRCTLPLACPVNVCVCSRAQPKTWVETYQNVGNLLFSLSPFLGILSLLFGDYGCPGSVLFFLKSETVGVLLEFEFLHALAAACLQDKALRMGNSLVLIPKSC